MVHPVFVDHAQQHHALKLAHDGGGDGLLLALVGGDGGVEEQLRQLVLAHGGELSGRFGDHAAREVHTLEAAEDLAHAVLVELTVLAGVERDLIGNAAADHAEDGILEVAAVEHLLALPVDDLALLVHHVVVFKRRLTGLEVAGLDAGLCVLDGLREHLVLDGRVLVEVHAVHEVRDALAAEQAQQIVLEREVEARLARVALTAGTAAELIVDAAGVVALGADDEQTAGLAHAVGLARDLGLVPGERFGEQRAGVEDLLIVGLGVAGRLGDQLIGEPGLAQIVLGHVFGVAAEHDVGAAARHVGGDRHRAELTGLRDDLGFLLVVLRVEQVMLDALAGEQIGQVLVLLDGHRADQHGLALGVAFLDLRDDRAVLCRLGLVHHVGIVDTRDGAVGGDLDDVEVVDGAEFLLLGQRCTGHTGELLVKAEVILEGDGRERLALAGDGDVLLGLDGLMQTLAVAAAEHQSARELVDDDDLAVLDDVVDVALHRAVRLDGLIDVVGDGGVLGIGEVLDLEILLGLGDAAGGERRGLGLFVHDVVGVNVDVLFLLFVRLRDDLLAEAGDESLGAAVHLRGLLPDAGDDERRARLVDEDGVHLVHDGEGVAALHQLGGEERHVVAQVVEAHLIVGAVGDVGGVGRAALVAREVMDDQAHAQAEEAVHLAHPLAVALGKVVVHGDDVHAVSGEGVEVSGESGDERFALAGLHLGDAPLMEHDAADELHAVGIKPEHAARGLAHGGEGFGQNVVERFAVGEPRLEFRRLGAQLLVRQGAVLVRHRLDLIDDRINALELPLGVGAEELGDQSHIKNFLSRKIEILLQKSIKILL